MWVEYESAVLNTAIVRGQWPNKVHRDLFAAAVGNRQWVQGTPLGLGGGLVALAVRAAGNVSTFKITTHIGPVVGVT